MIQGPGMSTHSGFWRFLNLKDPLIIADERVPFLAGCVRQDDEKKKDPADIFIHLFDQFYSGNNPDNP